MTTRKHARTHTSSRSLMLAGLLALALGVYGYAQYTVLQALYARIAHLEGAMRLVFQVLSESAR